MNSGPGVAIQVMRDVNVVRWMIQSDFVSWPFEQRIQLELYSTVLVL